ncbi:MAG: Ig-like domain repeat protein [Terriglobales bacterium]
MSKINPAGSALVYSTYLGGSSDDFGGAIAVDGAGNAYVTGSTGSTDFPTMNPLQPKNGSGGFGENAFISKINPSGSALVYSTYLGGGNYDGGNGIAVDSAGNVYVTGFTQSPNFPTKNPLQSTLNGGYQDAFISEINPSGSALVYSTYLGGGGDIYIPNAISDSYAIAVDSAGNAYITGSTNSPYFPLKNADQSWYIGDYDAFVAKLNPSGSGLVYSTYLGGDGYDAGGGVAVDGAGNIYIVGGTSSADFRMVNSLQPTYGGNGDAFVAEIKVLIETTTMLTSSVNPSSDGQPVTFTASVTPAVNAGAVQRDVTFYDGATALGSMAICDGQATFSTSSLSPGAHSITARYSGDTNYLPSTSAGLTETVNQAGTTLTLSSSVNPSGLDQPVTFTAGITPQYGGQASGTVTFQDGSTTLGSAAVSGNAASLTTSSLAVGTHSVTAVYSGDSDFTGTTSNTVKQVVKKVEKAKTAIALSSSANPSTYGEAVTFTAVVTPAPPDGETVTFKRGATVLGTGTLSGGSASLTTSALPLGKSTITAVYGGDSNFASSTSNAVKQVVNKYATTTTLVSSPNPSVYGQAVTWTATVTSSGPNTPTGKVNFGGNGSASLSGGVATLTKICWLNAGTNAVTAKYMGNADSAPSTSSVLEQVVNPVSTTTAITSSANPSSLGQSVTFTATVTSSTEAHATGTVTFTAGGTTLGTVALSGIHASISTAALPEGATTITATYNGANDYTGSSGAMTQTVE